MEKAIRKIFVVGGQIGYAKWMQGKLVPTIEEADLVVFTGGEDINPSLYGDRLGRYTRFNDQRDIFEIAAFNKAVRLDKYIWGTCRGAQLICALNGGRLIQDMQHPSYHKFTAWDGKEYDVTSAHHQMLLVENSSVATHVLGHTKCLSPYHLDGQNKDVSSRLPISRINGRIDEAGGYSMEPEIVYFENMVDRPASKINRSSSGLCIQGHPEWMEEDSPTVIMLQGLLTSWMNPERTPLHEKLGLGMKAKFPWRGHMEQDNLVAQGQAMFLNEEEVGVEEDLDNN